MVLSAYAIPGIKECDKNDILSMDAKIARIINKVSNFYNIDERKLLAKTRKRQIVVARQFCMYFLRINLQLPLKYIGELMGGFDHTTVLHGMATIKDQLSIKSETQIKSDYQILIKII